MRTPTTRHLSFLGLLVGLVLLTSPAARAEEGAEMDEASKKVKEQMEKILELMRQNEDALLQISTGARDEPRRVDVQIPDVPPGGEGGGAAGESGASGQGGTSSGAQGRSAAGREAVQKLEEIIRGQRSTSGQIPGELEELVRMVPQ